MTDHDVHTLDNMLNLTYDSAVPALFGEDFWPYRLHLLYCYTSPHLYSQNGY